MTEVVGHAKEAGEKGKAEVVWRCEIGEGERREGGRNNRGLGVAPG